MPRRAAISSWRSQRIDHTAHSYPYPRPLTTVNPPTLDTDWTDADVEWVNRIESASDSEPEPIPSIDDIRRRASILLNSPNLLTQIGSSACDKHDIRKIRRHLHAIRSKESIHSSSRPIFKDPWQGTEIVDSAMAETPAVEIMMMDIEDRVLEDLMDVVDGQKFLDIPTILGTTRLPSSEQRTVVNGMPHRPIHKDIDRLPLTATSKPAKTVLGGMSHLSSYRDLDIPRSIPFPTHSAISDAGLGRAIIESMAFPLPDASRRPTRNTAEATEDMTQNMEQLSIHARQ